MVSDTLAVGEEIVEGVEEVTEVVEVLCDCGCADVLQPYLNDILTVSGHIEAILWFGVLWLVAFLLYKLIRVFV